MYSKIQPKPQPERQITVEEMFDAADYWDELADNQELEITRAKEFNLGDTTVFENRAKLYRQVAKEIREPAARILNQQLNAYLREMLDQGD